MDKFIVGLAAIILLAAAAYSAVTYEKKKSPVTLIEPRGLTKMGEFPGVGEIYRYESVEMVCIIIPTGVSCL
jgi:hypothetical protein